MIDSLFCRERDDGGTIRSMDLLIVPSSCLMGNLADVIPTGSSRWQDIALVLMPASVSAVNLVVHFIHDLEGGSNQMRPFLGTPSLRPHQIQNLLLRRCFAFLKNDNNYNPTD